MLRTQVLSGISHVGLALRDPEEFAARWNRGAVDYRLPVWAALATTAVLGTMLYGFSMGMFDGAGAMLLKGLKCTTAAGLAWCIPLPALYILNSLAGSRLPAGSTLLAALVTVSWGGLAMIASVPINMFFTATVPHGGFLLLVNLVVFTGVGVAMIDVFHRVMARLEPSRAGAPTWWLLLVGAIGAELFYAFGLFAFGS